MQFLSDAFEFEFLIMAFAALAAFATVITIAAPYFENDKLNARIKSVGVERERLRAAQKAMLDAPQARLRDVKKAGAYEQIVESLNLKKVFEAETSRDLLRSAGYRTERHLMTFLASRVIVPAVLAVAVFVYCSTVMSSGPSPMPINMRIGAAMVGIMIGFYLPYIMIKNMVSKRQASIKRAWSDALDLLLICVEAGMALEPAMQRVAKEIGSQSVPLAEELQLTVAELSYLPDRRKGLENLAKRTNLDTVKSVVTSLIQSERYGTPLGAALRVLAQENRNDRMLEAEKKAASLPPKLTVPMILFFLPVIFVVILGPAAIIVLRLD